MATISQAIRHGQREIRRQEGVAFRRLLAEYEQLWWFIERQIRGYETQIAMAAARGEPVNPAWLRQQRWYTQLQQSVDDQLQRFNRSALGIIAQAQRSAVSTAIDVSGMVAAAINPSIVARVNPYAFELWVSAMHPTSPLQVVFDRFDRRVSAIIQRHLTDGIGAGQGINTMVRRMAADIGPTAQVGRLTTIARTETMRAYRGASFDQFSALGPNIIAGWEWMAAKSPRTCLACIVMDGRRFPFDQYPNRFHVCCRCVVRPIPHPRLVPGSLPQRETGAEWLARQDEQTQLQVFGSQARLDLWRQGVPLDEFIGVHRSRLWGDSVFVKPIEAIRVPSPSGGVRLLGRDDTREWFAARGIHVSFAGDDNADVFSIVAQAYQREITAGRPVNDAVMFGHRGWNGPIASYTWSDPRNPGRGDILINMDSPFWTDPAVRRRAADSGWFYDPTPEGVITHEIGHWRHATNVVADEDGNWTSPMGLPIGDSFPPPMRGIAGKVSQYAATDPSEFVAEVYSGLAKGDAFDDEVMRLYRFLGGPEL